MDERRWLDLSNVPPTGIAKSKEEWAAEDRSKAPMPRQRYKQPSDSGTGEAVRGFKIVPAIAERVRKIGDVIFHGLHHNGHDHSPPSSAGQLAASMPRAA
jgi:hypothetical protein